MELIVPVGKRLQCRRVSALRNDLWFGGDLNFYVAELQSWRLEFGCVLLHDLQVFEILFRSSYSRTACRASVIGELHWTGPSINNGLSPPNFNFARQVLIYTSRSDDTTHYKPGLSLLRTRKWKIYWLGIWLQSWCLAEPMGLGKGCPWGIFENPIMLATYAISPGGSQN